MRHFCLLLLGGMVLGACGGGGGTGPTPNTLVVNAGNNQVGPAGAALPESLAVIVSDQNGDPLAGVDVGFAVTAGNGSVSPTSRRTNASGIAKTRYTLGPNAGTQTVRATAIDFGLAPAQFSAVAQINGAVNIANSTTGVLTDTVDAIKAESLTVLVTDQNATPVPGVTVAWGSTGGLVSATAVPTNAAGLSKVRFTYGTAAGSQSASATVTGLVGSPVTINFTAAAGTAVSIHKVGGDQGTTTPGSQATYTVQSRDTRGNPKGGVVIDWAVAAGGGSITPAQNTTQANGNASATRTLGAGTGDQTATATANGLPSTPVVTFTTTAAIVTTVQVANNSFTPNTLTVPVNTVVSWNWANPTVLHNVTFDAPKPPGTPADIPDKSTVGTVNRTFTTDGTFTYRCTNHPGMTGTVTVTP